MYRPQKGATPKVIEELEESASNKVLLIKNSIKQSMRAIKTGKELKNIYRDYKLIYFIIEIFII